MGNIEEKLKALREAAKLQSQATIVEEIVDIPEDIDENRLVKIAKELHKTTLLESTPDLTSFATVIDEIPEEDEPEFPDEIPIVDKPNCDTKIWDLRRIRRVPHSLHSKTGLPMTRIII